MNQHPEQYRKMAANYDHMALAINDQALRWVYLDFAQQWRELAHQVEIVELDRPKHSGRWSDARIS
jgi:hypothetical protein